MHNLVLLVSLIIIIQIGVWYLFYLVHTWRQDNPREDRVYSNVSKSKHVH